MINHDEYKGNELTLLDEKLTESISISSSSPSRGCASVRMSHENIVREQNKIKKNVDFDFIL